MQNNLMSWGSEWHRNIVFLIEEAWKQAASNWHIIIIVSNNRQDLFLPMIRNSVVICSALGRSLSIVPVKIKPVLGKCISVPQPLSSYTCRADSVRQKCTHMVKGTSMMAILIVVESFHCQKVHLHVEKGLIVLFRILTVCLQRSHRM